MAGKVQEAKLDGVTRRARLKRGRQAHWRQLHRDPERSLVAHLGWQRWEDDKAGRWVLRTYRNGKYNIVPLGTADDADPADGVNVLSFDQATANALAQIGAPKHRTARLTVRQALANYIEYKRSQGQLSAVADIESRGNAHIIPLLGDVAVADLTADRLRKWLSALASSPAMSRPKANGKQNYRAEPSTEDDVRRRRSSANRVLTMLKAALNFAYDEGLVASNASWGRRLKGFRDVEAARIRYLSVPEAERLINAADRDFKPLIQAALATGARYSELAALRGQDFNPDAGTVAVRRSKTGKGRHIVLTTEGADLFTQLCAGRSGNELIFTHGNGAPWEKSDQLRPMAEAVRHARIKPPISFHGLRHTYASLAIMAGCPILVCAKNLGHTDGRMCEKHYGHLSASFVRDQIRATAPTFGFKPDKKIAVLENKRPR